MQTRRQLDIIHTCLNCHKKFHPLYSSKNKLSIYCCIQCKFTHYKPSLEARKKVSIALAERNSKNRGERHPKWKGGKIISSGGYFLIYSPKHPNKNYSGYVYEHRLVMEKILGRYLTKHEVVHHKNHIQTDNRIENLELTDCRIHNTIHKLGKKHSYPRKPRPYRMRDKFGRFTKPALHSH